MLSPATNLEEKTCSKCGKSKSLDEFYPDTRGEKGRRADCKVCRRAYNNAINRENRKRKDARDRRWRENNLDRMRDQRRRGNLRNRFGIGLDEYSRLLETQNGVCAICGDPPDGGGNNGNSLHVDHDHETGVVRGLLCRLCNMLLGLARDRPEVCQAVARYLLAAPSAIPSSTDSVEA